MTRRHQLLINGQLVTGAASCDGFAALRERGRLDLTVEALVVQSRFADLFTPAEIEIAHPCLGRFGYN